MLLKTVLSTALLASLFAFSGCSSDTKEKVEQDAKQLIADCITGKLSKDECEEQGKDIEARAKALQGK